MTKIYELPERIDPIEEASTWLARLDRGLNADEEKALRDWLAAHPRNPAVLIEVAQVWDKMDCLSRLAELFPEPAPVPARRFKAAWAAVASLLIAALLGLWMAMDGRPGGARFTPSGSEAAEEQLFETAIGESNSVVLADGSTVILNTNSRVRVQFTADSRLLVLERGEVFVHVAPDPLRPFRARIGERIVEALGTAFNLKITQDQSVELIVTEGRVLVGVIDKTVDAGQRAVRDASGATAVTVSAGERLVLTDDDAETDPVAPEEIEVRLSWRGGNLVFRGESLEDALSEIERYTPVEFVILDEDLKKVRVVGMFKSGDVEGLLATLRRNFDITYQRIGDEEIVLTRAR